MRQPWDTFGHFPISAFHHFRVSSGRDTVSRVRVRMLIPNAGQLTSTRHGKVNPVSQNRPQGTEALPSKRGNSEMLKR